MGTLRFFSENNRGVYDFMLFMGEDMGVTH